MTGGAYDLLVIGSGPAGHSGAITAARLGRRVAIVDWREAAGGAGLSGMVASRALREAILHATGGTAGCDFPLAGLAERVQLAVERDRRIARDELRRSGVEEFPGRATFVDSSTLEVTTAAGQPLFLRAAKFLVACGSRAASPPDLPLDGVRTFSAQDLFRLEKPPRELLVVGAGVVGLELASTMSALGVPVTVAEQRASMLPFADREVVETLAAALRRRGVAFHFGAKVTRVTVLRDGRIRASIEGSRPLHAEALLLAVGRQANGDLLAAENAGLRPCASGRLHVDGDFRTAVPHVFAAGAVIGGLSLASTSAEQGRVAVERAFGRESRFRPELLPVGIYTIPEVATVGLTEHELTARLVPYEVGIAHFDELSRGRLQGGAEGILKILFDRRDRKVLGIHIVGEAATELVHVGQTVISLEGTIDTLAGAVFNTPTFSEAYRAAARNGLDRL